MIKIYYNITNSNIDEQPLCLEVLDNLKRFKVWTSLEGNCNICLEDYKWLDNIIELPCKNKFHSGCVTKWFNEHSTCPLCRYKLNPNNYVNLNNIVNDIFRVNRSIITILEHGVRNYLL